MPADPALQQRIRRIVRGAPVVLFMKGTREGPRCGFSARVVAALDTHLADYRTLDVLQDPGLRGAIKEFSEWPTIPQLYVGGEFVGGCDIVCEMHESGELRDALLGADG